MDKSLQENRKRELRNLALSDPKYRNDPTALSERMKEIDSLFNVDNSDIEAMVHLPDNLKERAIAMRQEDVENRQAEMFNERDAREQDIMLKSQISNAVLDSELEGLSNHDKAERILEARRMRANAEAITELPKYVDQERLNSGWETIKGAAKGFHAQAENIIGGVLKTGANAIDMSGRALTLKPQQEFDDEIMMLSLAGKYDEVEKLTAERLKEVEEYNKSMEKDATMAGINNATIASAYAVGDFFGLSDRKEFEAIAYNTASENLIKQKTQQYLNEGKMGNTLFLKADGSVDREFARAMARTEVLDITHPKNANGERTMLNPSDITNPEFTSAYRREFDKQTEHRRENIIPSTELETYFDNPTLDFVRETGEGMIKSAGVKLKDVAEIQANSETQEKMKGIYASVDETFDNLGIENQLIRDITKSTVTPLSNPLTFATNQAIQASDFLAVANPLTALGSVVGNAQNNEKEIREAIKSGQLPKDLTEQQIAYLAGQGGASAAVGILGDRLMLNVAKSTGSALKNIPKEIAGKTGSVTKGVASHAVNKVSSSYANIAEAELMAQATNTNPNAKLSELERNKIIGDSSMPSISKGAVSQAVGVGKAVTNAGKNLANKTVLKTTEFATSSWGKAKTKFEEGKDYLKDTVVDLAGLRTNIDSVESEGNTSSETRQDINSTIADMEESVRLAQEEVNKPLDQYNKDNGTNLSREEYSALKRQTREYTDANNAFIQRAKDAVNKSLSDVKTKYSDLSKNKESKPEDVVDMSDDILRNYDSMNYSKAEINALASSPAVQNNPQAKETFDLIKTMYGVDSSTTDRGTGFVAPLSRDHVPRNNAERVTKEFFYGGGKNPDSLGIMTYIDRIRDARRNNRPQEIENLLGHANNWLNTQTNRVNNGKLYGKILERAKYEQSLIERVVKYGEGHLAKLQKTPTTPIQNIDTQTNFNNVQEQNSTPTIEENNNSLSGLLKGRISQIREESESQRAINNIIPNNTEEVLSTLETNKEKNNEIVVNSMVEDYQAGKLDDNDIRVIEETLNNSQNNEELSTVVEKVINNNSKEAIDSIDNNKEAIANIKYKDYKPKVQKDLLPETISREEISDNIGSMFHEVGNDPNVLLRIANTTNLDTRDLPLIALASSKTRDNDDPRFQALKNHAINMTILSNAFVKPLVRVSDQLNKLVNNISNLQDLLPTLNDSDKAKAEQEINNNYLEMAKLNLELSRVEGIKDISGFVREVTQGLFDKNRETLKELNSIDSATLTKFKTNQKGTPYSDYTTLESMAKADAKPETEIFSTPKGLFNFAITKGGKVLSNSKWLYDKESFVREAVRRLRNDTHNITEERDESITEAVSNLHDTLVSDIGNDFLNPEGSNPSFMDSKFYRKGQSSGFRQSPLSAVLYNTDTGNGLSHNIFSDNMKATIIVNGLQSVKENVDLIFRDRYSVSQLLNRPDTNMVSGSEYRNFSRIGIPSSAFADRLQDSFYSTFSLNMDESKVPSGLRERMASEASLMAINYLVDVGVLKETTYTGDQLNSMIEDGEGFFGDKISFLTANYSIDENNESIFSESYKSRMSSWDNFYDLGYSITGNESSRKNAQPVKANTKRVKVNLQTDTYTARLLKGTQKHANETTYHVTPYFKDVVTNLDDMKELLGFNERIEDKVVQKIMLDSAIAGREGELTTLTNNVSYLQNNQALIDNGFKQPMSIYSNGRTAITSNLLNMMTDKVSRAFLHLNSFEKTRSKETINSDSHPMFLYGLAFRMGHTENASQESFTNAVDQIHNMDIPDSVRASVTAMRENRASMDDFRRLIQFGKGVFTEVDNNLGVINSVYELTNYREVLDGNIDNYKSYLTVDDDAKNSGVAITRATFGEKNVLGSILDKQNLNQVGIYVGNTFDSFGHFSQQKGNFDAYQFVIKKGMESVTNEGAENKAIINAMNKLSEALGEPLYTETSVHKILREIAKPLLMTAYYEAGKKSLMKSAKQAVMDNIVKRMNDITVKQDQNALDNFNKAFGVKFDFVSITNGLDNRGMERFYNNTLRNIAEPIATMAVDGVVALTESTEKNRKDIIKTINSFSENIQMMFNSALESLNKDGKFVSQEQTNILNSFVDSSTMRLATSSGSYNAESFGLNLANYEKATVAQMVGASVAPNLRGVDTSSMSKQERASYDRVNHAYQQNQTNAIKNNFLVSSEDRVTLPKFKALGNLGVGALAKKAHAEDSGIVNDVYLNHDNPVLAIYDQFTTTPEDISSVAKIANESFKERTLNNSVTEDFTKGASKALENSIREYLSNPELQSMIPKEAFSSYIDNQIKLVQKLSAISNTVDNRRESMFGNDRNVVIDNYPLGHIDNTPRSASDNTPVNLFDKVAKYKAIKNMVNEALKYAKQFDASKVPSLESKIKSLDRSIKTSEKLSKNYQDIVKARDGISIDKLQEWANQREGLIATEETITNTLGTLVSIDGNRIDSETLRGYNDVITQLVSPILETASELNPNRKQTTIKINDEMKNQESYGYFSSKDNEVVVSLSANKASDFSNSEVFVHELVHSVTYDTINKDKELRSEVLNVYNDARNQAKINGWDNVNNENHGIWNYVFNNPNTTKSGTSVGLLEFVSYGLSNPKMIDLLKSTQSEYVNYRTPFEVMSGTGLFSKLINSVANAVVNYFTTDYTMKNSDAYTSLFETVRGIDNANKGVLSNLKLSKEQSIIGFRDAVTSVNRVFENVADQTLQAIKNKVSKIDETDPNQSTAFRTIMSLKGLDNSLRHKLITDLVNDPSKSHEIIDEAFLNVKRNRLMNNQGDLKTAKNSLIGGFNNASKVKNLIIKGIQKGTSDANLARNTIKERLKNFTDNISTEEDTAFTAGIMNTEMFRLVNTIGANELARFVLGTGVERQNTISRVEAHLKANLPKAQAVSIMNQLNGLANNLSGRGKLAPMQMTNTHNIINGLYAPVENRALFEENSELLNSLKDSMDTFVAMRAYFDSNDEVRSNIENIFSRFSNAHKEPNEILINALNVANEVRNTSLEKDFGGNPTMMSYGYVSKMGDPNIMEHYVPQKEVDKYIKDGWTVIAEAKNLSATAGQPIIMLTKRIPPEISYNEHALHSKHQKNPLDNSIATIKKLYGEDSALVTKKEQNDSFNNQSLLAWNGSMLGNKNNTIPIIDASGKATGITHNSNKNTLPLTLQKDRQFSEVIADEYSRVAGDFTSKETSVELIHALKEDFDTNMSKDPNSFTFITKDKFLPDGSRNPFYESYQRLTPEVKQTIAEAFGNDGFYVREGMARAVIGTKKIDISKNPVVDKLDSIFQDRFKTDKSLQPIIRTGDAIWREVIQRSKSAIAVMNPAVFLMNYASNATMLMVNGISPAQIYQYTKESFVELKKYENTMKELNDVDLRLTNQPNNRNLLARKTMLENRLNSSLTKQMMDEGMLQSVTTDIKYEEYGYLNRAGNKVVSEMNNINPDLKLGDRSSKIFKEVFMVGDSTTGTMMSYLNQVMDYTSRYTYLKGKEANQKNVSLDRRDSRENLVREAQDLFINYALPDSRGIEFANDMGIVWFSKYYLGIQHVIMNLMKTKPVNSLAYLLGVSQIYQADDIYKNFFAVDAPSKLFRTPIDALETLAVPPMLKAFY